jgi:hypothetical protein
MNKSTLILVLKMSAPNATKMPEMRFPPVTAKRPKDDDSVLICGVEDDLFDNNVHVLLLEEYQWERKATEEAKAYNFSLHIFHSMPSELMIPRLHNFIRIVNPYRHALLRRECIGLVQSLAKYPRSVFFYLAPEVAYLNGKQQSINFHYLSNERTGTTLSEEDFARPTESELSHRAELETIRARLAGISVNNSRAIDMEEDDMATILKELGKM